MNSLKTITNFKATLGECPLWDAENKIIYWIDIVEKKIFSLNIIAEISMTINLNNFVGCIVLKQNGNLLVATENGFYSLNQGTLSFKKLCDPEESIPTNRFNDGKCDASGRFWAGTTALDECGNKGSLYFLDKNLKCKKVISSIYISNGITWSLDNRTMYFNDSPTRKVKAFDYDIKTGIIKNGRVIITFNKEDGYPDGMTIDSEGKLWIAHWGGYGVGRWDPQTGRIIDKIDIPAKRVSSVTFGGPDLDDLYITTARRGFIETEDEVAGELGGCDGMLFSIKTNLKGIDTFRFAS